MSGLRLKGTVRRVATRAAARWRSRPHLHSLLGIALPCVLTVVLLRPVLFERASAWKCYGELLARCPSGLGQTEKQLIALEEKRWGGSVARRSTAYLTVGSSQVGSIFGNDVYRARGGEVFGRFAAQPFDFWMYREAILRRNPRVVLLYLSELDLAQVPRLELMTVLPAQGRSWTFAARTILAHRRLWEHPFHELGRSLIAELFPEYKYSFVFRSALEGCVLADLEAELGGAAGRAKVVMSAFPLRGAGVDLQLAFLDAFLRHLDERGVRVVLLEGQYRPDREAASGRKLRPIVRARLAEFAEKFAGVEYVAASRLVRFAAADFLDDIHVQRESGARFVEHLFAEVLR